MALTPRGRALRWLSTRRGTTENPPGSNRGGEITKAQMRLGSWLVGAPWCGVWACNAALAGGVRMTKPYRWASVWFIEVDAAAKQNGFRGWVPRPARAGRLWKDVYRGDLIVLFGPGVHVETIRDCSWKYRALGYVISEAGNTSPEGGGGSQSNGGGAYRRRRRISDIHGIAKVDYPG
jgi:hypothetical protein